MAAHAIVMICGPHHRKYDADGRQVCSAHHEGTRCFQRLHHAREIALFKNAPLFVCGDANGGADVDVYVRSAHAYGVAADGCYWTGKDPRASNTLIDVRMALEFLLRSSVEWEGFTLVTDGWHMPRAYLLAFKESLRLCTESGRRQYTIRPDACRSSWPPPAEMLLREQAGVLAIADGTYGQQEDTYLFGKPMLETLSRTG